VIEINQSRKIGIIPIGGGFLSIKSLPRQKRGARR